VEDGTESEHSANLAGNKRSIDEISNDDICLFIAHTESSTLNHEFPSIEIDPLTKFFSRNSSSEFK
jgi:hypothetical protein